MTEYSWRQRCAAITSSAAAGGFDVVRFVRRETVGDPHGLHLGVRVDALVPTHRADERIEDVALPVSRGAWQPPNVLCEPASVARRQVLADMVEHDGDPDAQMAVLTAAFVHSHVVAENRRRHAWPLDASMRLVTLAADHLQSLGTRMLLPAEGTYALMGTGHMCRSAPERYCDDHTLLDASVGEHLARSFRETTLLSLVIEAGGTAAPVRAASDTRSLLALPAAELAGLLDQHGAEGVCTLYRMKMRDLVVACRRRGIAIAPIAA